MFELLDQPETDQPKSGQSENASETANVAQPNPNENTLRLVGLGILAVTCIIALVLAQNWLFNQTPSNNSVAPADENISSQGRPRSYSDNRQVEPPQRRLMPRGRARVNTDSNDPQASSMDPSANRIQR